MSNYLETKYQKDLALSKISTVFAIHNLLYQGMCDFKFITETEKDSGKEAIPDFSSSHKPSLKFEIVHCHDWHTSMIPFLLRKSKAKTIFTIHNITYQGLFDADKVNFLIGTKFKGEVNCMRKGIKNANVITTVSPNYAKEILRWIKTLNRFDTESLMLKISTACSG